MGKSPESAGQLPFRAAWGVATFAKSGAIGGEPRLPTPPEKATARPQKDLEKVLSARDEMHDRQAVSVSNDGVMPRI